jgi:hypothetical protein
MPVCADCGCRIIACELVSGQRRRYLVSILGNSQNVRSHWPVQLTYPRHPRRQSKQTPLQKQRHPGKNPLTRPDKGQLHDWVPRQPILRRAACVRRVPHPSFSWGSSSGLQPNQQSRSRRLGNRPRLDLLLARFPEIALHLQTEPHLRVRIEGLPYPQRHLSRDRRMTIQHAGQRGSGHTQVLGYLFYCVTSYAVRQTSSRMGWVVHHCHACSVALRYTRFKPNPNHLRHQRRHRAALAESHFRKDVGTHTRILPYPSTQFATLEIEAIRHKSHGLRRGFFMSISPLERRIKR